MEAIRSGKVEVIAVGDNLAIREAPGDANAYPGTGRPLEGSTPKRRIAPKEGSAWYRKWRARWQAIKAYVNGGASDARIMEILERQGDNGIKCSRKTLRKTIEAGLAKELD